MGIIVLGTYANDEGRDYFVECRTCKSTYDKDVLEDEQRRSD